MSDHPPLNTNGHERPSPSKCCALKRGGPCGEPCLVLQGVELPFCETHNKDEALWRAWYELG